MPDCFSVGISRPFLSGAATADRGQVPRPASPFARPGAPGPAAGPAAGLTPASNENAGVKFREGDDGPDTPWLAPLTLTAGFVVSASSRLAWPRSGALRYEPLLSAFTSP